MKQVTTLEFRRIVRAAAFRNGISVLDAWTNGSRNGRVETGTRTVGLRINCRNSIMTGEQFAVLVENALNKSGLTAQTRYTAVDCGGRYIRGTCDFAV